MSLQFEPCDVITLEEFGGWDRFVPHRERMTPTLAAERISEVTFLSRDRGREFARAFSPRRKSACMFDPSRFHGEQGMSLHCFRGYCAEQRSQLEDWLARLPFDDEERLFVYWPHRDSEKSGCSALTLTSRTYRSWAAYAMFSAFDICVVAARDLDRMILSGPEAYALFVRSGPVDVAQNSFIQRGEGLLQVPFVA